MYNLLTKNDFIKPKLHPPPSVLLPNQKVYYSNENLSLGLPFNSLSSLVSINDLNME